MTETGWDDLFRAFRFFMTFGFVSDLVLRISNLAIWPTLDDATYLPIASALSEMSLRHQAPGQRMHLTAV
jgi:hypothetical protein